MDKIVTLLIVFCVFLYLIDEKNQPKQKNILFFIFPHKSLSFKAHAHNTALSDSLTHKRLQLRFLIYSLSFKYKRSIKYKKTQKTIKRVTILSIVINLFGLFQAVAQYQERSERRNREETTFPLSSCKSA